MKFFMKYMKGSRIKAFFAPLLKMTEATLELIVPIIISRIIDEGIPLGNKAYILKRCLVLVLFALAGFGISITAQYFSADASVSFVKRLRKAAYEKLQNLSFSSLDKIGSGTVLTRLTTDMDSVQTGINLTLRLLLRSPFVIIGAGIMAFTVDSKSALIFAVIIPILAFIVFFIVLFTMPYFKIIREKLEKLLSLTRENITGVRVIRAFNQEENYTEEFDFRNEVITKLQLFTGKISAITNPLSSIIINLGIIAVIYYGAIRVNSGLITTGCVVALYNYMTQISVEMIKFANLTVNVSKALAAGKRIKEFTEFGEETEDNSEKKSISTIEKITLDNISFAYNKKAENIIDSFTFDINYGDRIGIIGATGSGKSTLAQIISGYYKLTDGKILINGEDINSITESSLRDRIAYIEQKPFLFEGTVRSNLLMAKENAEESEIINALENAKAYDFVKGKDGELDCKVIQGGNNFSGGQKQRIAIARGLLKDSDVLILDDSTGSLDYMTESELMANIFEKYNQTLIIIAQRTGSIKNCDKIILLDDDKIVVGTHEELLKASETYREIHLSQFEEDEI